MKMVSSKTSFREVYDNALKDTIILSNLTKAIDRKLNGFNRAEKILSKNILILSARIRNLKEKLISMENSVKETKTLEEKSDLENLSLESLIDSLNEIKKEVSYLKHHSASKNEFKEIEYVSAIDSLQLVTLDQVKKLIFESKYSKN